MGNFVIIMHDGQLILTTGVNLKMVESISNKNNSIAVRLGLKSMSKNLVAAIAKEETLKKTKERNLKISVNETILYTTAETDVILDKITDGVNSKNFSVLNDEILINRSFYQYAEFVAEQNINDEETQADA